MNVCILTEGGGKKGFGHITRCLSLYQAFKEKNISSYFIINGDSSIKPIILGFDYWLIDWIQNFDRILSKLCNFDIIIIDSYIADEKIYRKISDISNLLVSIDDNNRIDYPKGIVINGNIGAEKINFPINTDIDYLLGEKYAFLRKEFWNIDSYKVNSEINNIFITLGGNDSHQLLPKLINLLKSNFPHINLKVIFGNSRDYNYELDLFNDDNNIELILNPSASDILDFMLNSDVAICGGGQTTYELACVGVPSIVISVADNQINSINNWVKSGFLEYAGNWDEKNLMLDVLNKIIFLNNEKIRQSKNKIAKNLVDGQGSKRIVDFIINKMELDKC